MAGAVGDDVRETLEEAANRRLLQVRRASYHVFLHTPLQGAKKGNPLLAPFFPFQHSPPRQHGFDSTFSSNTEKKMQDAKRTKLLGDQIESLDKMSSDVMERWTSPNDFARVDLVCAELLKRGSFVDALRCEKEGGWRKKRKKKVHICRHFTRSERFHSFAICV